MDMHTSVETILSGGYWKSKMGGGEQRRIERSSLRWDVLSCGLGTRDWWEAVLCSFVEERERERMIRMEKLLIRIRVWRRWKREERNNRDNDKEKRRGERNEKKDRVEEWRTKKKRRERFIVGEKRLKERMQKKMRDEILAREGRRNC